MNAGVRRRAYFSNLRPGRYDFEVTAASNQGEWNPNSARISMTVQPYFWQTLWFQLLSIVCVCGAFPFPKRNETV